MASSDHIEPREKGKITARVNIKGRTGALVKNVQVYSNDPKRPVVTLSLKAIIQ